jgi:hypothetical protein
MPVLKRNSLLEDGYYLPIKIRIPASSARIPMTLFGITKRTINGSPCKISQSASNIIPTDMLSLLFLIGRNKGTGYFSGGGLFVSIAKVKFPARFSLDQRWILARSTQGGDPLRLGDAPHAFARTVFLNAQVDGFGVLTQ